MKNVVTVKALNTRGLQALQIAHQEFEDLRAKMRKVPRLFMNKEGRGRRKVLLGLESEFTGDCHTIKGFPFSGEQEKKDFVKSVDDSMLENGAERDDYVVLFGQED